MSITWNKEFTSSDDGSALTGAQLGQIQTDIETKFGGSDAVANDDVKAGAGIEASKLTLTDVDGDSMTYSTGNHPKRSIVLMASSGWPSTTTGCSLPTQVEYTTNDQDLFHMDFATGADEHAQWTFVMPDSWDASTLTAVFYWTQTGGGAAETVRWAIQGISYANDAPIDATWGTAVTTDDTLIDDDDVHISSTSSAITLAGTPAAGELVQLRVYRDVGDDDLAVDARLIAVKLEYGAKQEGD